MYLSLPFRQLSKINDFPTMERHRNVLLGTPDVTDPQLCLSTQRKR